MAEVIVAAGGGVAPHDLLPVDLRRNRDMLSNGKSEHIFGVRKGESVAAVDGMSRKLWREK